MGQSKSSFYHKGTENQKTADIIMDLRRPHDKEVTKWTKEQKDECKEWLSLCERIFYCLPN